MDNGKFETAEPVKPNAVLLERVLPILIDVSALQRGPPSRVEDTSFLVYLGNVRVCEFGGGVVLFESTLVFEEGSVPIGTDGFLVGAKTIRVVKHSRKEGVFTPSTVFRAPCTTQESAGFGSVTPKARCENGVGNGRESTRNWR